MTNQTVAPASTTREILDLSQASVSNYILTKRRNHELGGIIAKLNHELMFGTDEKRQGAGAALEKLGYVLD